MEVIIQRRGYISPMKKEPLRKDTQVTTHLEHKKRKDKPTQVKEKKLANKSPVHIKGKILVNSKTHPYHAWHRNSGWC